MGREREVERRKRDGGESEDGKGRRLIVNRYPILPRILI
jgi:hypothetical protein